MPVNPNRIGTRTAPTIPITSVKSTALRIEHDDMKRLYNEGQAVETALRNQFIEAINNEYLEPLRNPTTDMIIDSFAFLRANYGQITPGQLKQRECAIDNLTYDPSTNMDTIFTKIQSFQDLCLITGNARSDTQLVTYAYLIFQRTGIFMQSLINWNLKADMDKTFPNFKAFMRIFKPARSRWAYN